jgi:hypothetical protein
VICQLYRPYDVAALITSKLTFWGLVTPSSPLHGKDISFAKSILFAVAPIDETEGSDENRQRRSNSDWLKITNSEICPEAF